MNVHQASIVVVTIGNEQKEQMKKHEYQRGGQSVELLKNTQHIIKIKIWSLAVLDCRQREASSSWQLVMKAAVREGTGTHCFNTNRLQNSLKGTELAGN